MTSLEWTKKQHKNNRIKADNWSIIQFNSFPSKKVSFSSVLMWFFFSDWVRETAGKCSHNSPRTLPFEAITGVPKKMRGWMVGRRGRCQKTEKEKKEQRRSSWLENSRKNRVPVSVAYICTKSIAFILNVNHEWFNWSTLKEDVLI